MYKNRSTKLDVLESLYNILLTIKLWFFHCLFQQQLVRI